MYNLKFTPDEAGRKRYAICYQSFVTTNRVAQLSEYDDIVGVLKGLKAIGVPTEKLRGLQLYDLRPSGGELELTSGERAILLSHINEPIWAPLFLEEVLSIKSWISGAPDNGITGRIDRSV